MWDSASLKIQRFEHSQRFFASDAGLQAVMRASRSHEIPTPTDLILKNLLLRTAPLQT
jgi:hypothetical protein